MADIPERLRTSHFAIPNCDLSRAAAIVAASLTRLGWAVEGQDLTGYTAIIAASMPEHSARAMIASRAPQRLRITLGQESGAIGVGVVFAAYPAYWRYLDRMYVGGAAALAVGLLLGLFLPGEGLAGLVPLLFFTVGAVPPLLRVFRLSYGDKYRDFLSKLIADVHEAHGFAPTHFAEARVFPTTEHIFTRNGLVFFAALLFGLFLQSDPDLAIPPLIVAVVLGIPVALLAVTLVRPSYQGRASAYQLMMFAGVGAAMFTATPMALAFLLDVLPSATPVLGVAGLLAFSVPILVTSSELLSLGRELRRELPQAPPAAAEGPWRAATSMLVVSLWTICAFFNIAALILTVSGIERLAFGRNVLLPTKSMAALDALYGAPGVALFCAPFVLMIGLSIRNVLMVRNVLQRVEEPTADVRAVVDDVCDVAGIETPRVALIASAAATSSAAYVPGTGSVLWLSDGATRLLTRDELASVIAHEAYHLRSHTKVFALLDTLSAWTFFGKGFLGILFDTRKLEFDADAFAVTYLRQRQIAPTNLVSALQKIVGHNQVQGVLARASRGMGVAAAAPHDRAPTTLWEKLRWLGAVYFGEAVVAYLYPTVSERIERIEGIKLDEGKTGFSPSG